jgi:hypothetical protein
MYSFRYIFKNKPVHFIAFILFASTIHYSALLFIPFYLILRIPVNKASFLTVAACAMTVLIFLDPILNFITKYFYTVYDANNPEYANGLSPVYTIFFLAFYLLAFYLRKLLIAKNKNNIYLINSMLFGVVFSFFGISHGIVARIALFFILTPVVILSAEMYHVIKTLFGLIFKRRDGIKISFAIALITIAVVLSEIFYFYLLTENYNGVVPYQSVFDVSEEGNEL